jgi:hypothetical protein
MSDPFVVKVQKSLFSSGPRTILIYDSSGEIQYQNELTKEMDKEIPSEREFYWAIITKKGKLELQGEPITEDAESQFEQFNYTVMNP